MKGDVKAHIISVGSYVRVRVDGRYNDVNVDRSDVSRDDDVNVDRSDVSRDDDVKVDTRNVGRYDQSR